LLIFGYLLEHTAVGFLPHKRTPDFN